MKIVLANNQNKYRLNIRGLNALTLSALRALDLPEGSSLSINFVGCRDIKRLNKKYFSRDRATDVIALGYRDKRHVCRRHDLQDNYLGDIIICQHAAVCNAKDYNKSFKHEISLYIVHGILHLLGYSDTAAASRKKIEKKQEAILAKIWKP